MPVRRGHVAPQNTFLDTIIRKFEGQSEWGAPGAGAGGVPGGTARVGAPGEGLGRHRGTPGADGSEGTVALGGFEVMGTSLAGEGHGLPQNSPAPSEFGVTGPSPAGRDAAHPGIQASPARSGAGVSDGDEPGWREITPLPGLQQPLALRCQNWGFPTAPEVLRDRGSHRARAPQSTLPSSWCGRSWQNGDSEGLKGLRAPSTSLGSGPDCPQTGDRAVVGGNATPWIGLAGVTLLGDSCARGLWPG